MLTQTIKGITLNVEKVSNMKIVKRVIRITKPKYTHKLTYDYYEPHNTSYFHSIITANIGVVGIGLTSINLDNIYRSKYVLGDNYEELEQIKKEIEDKQAFMKLKREQETLELEEEYKTFMR